MFVATMFYTEGTPNKNKSESNSIAPSLNHSIEMGIVFCEICELVINESDDQIICCSCNKFFHIPRLPKKENIQQYQKGLEMCQMCSEQQIKKKNSIMR